MPYSCVTCGATIEFDNTPCPTCEVGKTSWTVVADQTRGLVISRKRVRLLAGDLDEALPPDDPALEAVSIIIESLVRAGARRQAIAAASAAIINPPRERHQCVPGFPGL